MIVQTIKVTELHFKLFECVVRKTFRFKLIRLANDRGNASPIFLTL